MVHGVSQRSKKGTPEMGRSNFQILCNLAWQLPLLCLSHFSDVKEMAAATNPNPKP